MSTATLTETRAIRRTDNVTVKLHAAQREKIKFLADYQKRTPHYFMIAAIDAYVQVVETERAIMQKVDASIEHLETTGLHVTGEEMTQWLAAKRLHRNTPLPVCHI